MAESRPKVDDTVDQKLKNKFFLIRHGQAFSNTEGILVSNPDMGIKKYGLTDTGKQQAKEAAETLRSLLSLEDNLSEKVLVVSSDFLRAKETAEIIHCNLVVKQPIRFEIALRERRMGDLDMTSDFNVVRKLWSHDRVDPTHNEYGAESVMEMVVRLSHLIQQLDKEYTGRIIVMISHGDPSQCIHTVFMGLSPSEFRTQPGFQNCEIRQLLDSEIN